MAMQLILVRHAEAHYRTPPGRYLPDGGLTEAGEAQARALRPAFAEMNIGAVLISPCRRARKTAAIAGLSGKTMSDLAEWQYEPYNDALTAGRPEADDPMWIWQQAWSIQPNAPETLDAVRQRAQRIIDSVARVNSGTSPIVIISHGHLLRLLTATWLDLPALAAARLELPPAGTGCLTDDRGYRALDAWNARPEAIR